MSEVVLSFGAYPSAHAGAERMAWRTAESLSQRGHRVTALTDSRPLAGGAGVTVADPASFDRDAGHPAPDVVHAFDLARPEYVSRALALARRRGAVFALTPASDPAVWPDPAVGRLACGAADVVFALTTAETEALCAIGARRDRVRRIPQAPDLSGQPDAAAFRRRLPSGGKVVLFMARRTRRKGYHLVLDSTRAVWQRHPDTTFVVAGPGADEHLPVPTDRRLYDLGIADEQTKLDALAACDVLCLPTTADVFPLLFVEAWSYGKPVVSGPFPGAGEVVRDGVDGIVAPPTTDGVATALIGLLSDDARRLAMGRAGRERVRAGFTWDSVVTAVEDGYRRAAEGVRR